MTQVPGNLQNFLQPKQLFLQQQQESVKYRPKSSSTGSHPNRSMLQNYHIITNNLPKSQTRRRIVKKYFNGGSDAISVEMRNPIKQKRKYSIQVNAKNSQNIQASQIQQNDISDPKSQINMSQLERQVN